VTVECEKGYDIGLISRELFLGVDITEESLLNLYPILSKVNEEKVTMEELLKSKISAENESLGLCRSYCHGRKVGTFLEVISTEFQYDHKKLTLYVTKSGEVSVCKLVRKLFDSFHTRICVEEIQSVEEIIHATQRYLELTHLPLPFHDVYYEPTRMPPQSEALRNQKSNKKNQRSQNGYTQSGANSTLLSALHHYRPTFSSGMNTAPPHTMGYATQLSARGGGGGGGGNLMYTHSSTMLSPSPSLASSATTQQQRYDQRFNERVYHPHSVMRDMTSQYQMYETTTATPYQPTMPATLMSEELHYPPPPLAAPDYSQYHLPSSTAGDYSQYPQPSSIVDFTQQQQQQQQQQQPSGGYYTPSLEEAMMYPPPPQAHSHSPSQPYHHPSPTYRDPNLYSYADQTAIAAVYQPSLGTYSSPYPEDQSYLTSSIPMPLTDQDLLPSLHSSALPPPPPPHALESPSSHLVRTNLTPSLSSVQDSEFPHYVVRY
jgi:hypothetical protein